ncbi:MAG: hypothetical protein COZ16_04070 [Flavobacteriaceae bacterium CG_4_10_14_3_um_filter_31_253]|nr:DUF3892 domain-containing protein [Flavobacteriales bacterium]NCT16993.1 DUF3892 domain-containing protein [Flavobacteriia bacterium]PIV97616.1 MAG: hypothetical protein COW43_02150 [Flavobacteriaceae bacterium CG17_big_fil_post_rev_8_21_14_2_50_31_13]PIX11191.1 MAG: hypothetical protein COZ74_14695 [Flavobacteriaceae bacterium CG_4_8_14_3_um_filter_31_8]PIY15483.1 MAG: hypothetical protein COZ16_04070 [Flavobacteriaceae bacterium CG_4_10_14_3_um_filter_31_253]PIZ09848.1 MAG: hypothetical p
MSKSADYFISGVWKDNSERITDVMLHTVNDNDSFQFGVKTSESSVINLLKVNKTIKTITWEYPDWYIGAFVTYVTIGSNEYLRTVANATVKDNLDNSINMRPIK